MPHSPKWWGVLGTASIRLFCLEGRQLWILVVSAIFALLTDRAHHWRQPGTPKSTRSSREPLAQVEFTASWLSNSFPPPYLSWWGREVSPFSKLWHVHSFKRYQHSIERRKKTKTTTTILTILSWCFDIKCTQLTQLYCMLSYLMI